MGLKRSKNPSTQTSVKMASSLSAESGASAGSDDTEAAGTGEGVWPVSAILTEKYDVPYNCKSKRGERHVSS